MPLFTLNEVQFQNDFDRESGSDNFDINSFRYPLDVGTTRYNHYMTFEIFVRDKINSDFGVETEGGDPVEYQIRKQLLRTRGSTIAGVTGGGSGNLGVSTGREISNPVRSAQQTNSTVSGSGGNNNSTNASRGNSVPGRRGTNYEQNANYAGQRNTTAAGSQNLSTAATAGAGYQSVERAMRKLKNDIASAFNTLKRAKESITLYMPDTLNFDYSHSYENVSLSSIPKIALAQMGLGLGAGAANATGLYKNKTNLTPFLTEMLDRGLEANGAVLGSLGYAVNPNFEVIYQSTNLRSFQFDFQFYPRSQAEALQVHKIINSFKFHAAPELVSGTFGRYLLAPSAFDIKFFYNGQINPNIPKISTCYLQNVQADYAPNGFSAYEVQGQNTPSLGGTGTPVAIRLQLQFMEGTMVTKELLRGQTLAALTTGGASF